MSNNTFQILEKDLHLYVLPDGDNKSYLLTNQNESILIDGSCSQIKEICKHHSLPIPKNILHTFINDDFIQSDLNLANVTSWIPEQLEYIASGKSSYLPEPIGGQYHLDHWADKRGEEAFGIMGCQTFFPLKKELSSFKTIRDGDIFELGLYRLKAIKTASHGKYSLSFFLYSPEGEVLTIFVGGLIKDHASMVNYYNCEWEYGLMKGLMETIDSLDKVMEHLTTQSIYPAYGLTINNGKQQCEELKRKIRNLLDWSKKKINTRPLDNCKRESVISNYVHLGKSIYQMDNGGNVIFFVNDKKEACLIDPGPCYYSSPEYFEEKFESDLKELQKQGIFNKITHVFITHMHGDHLDGLFIVRKLFDVKVLTTKEIGDIISHPEEYNYPSLSSSYDYFDQSIQIDEELEFYQNTLDHGFDITPFPLPGHCKAHLGILFRWKGIRVALVGDFLFAEPDSISANVVVAHNYSDESIFGYSAGIKEIIDQRPNMIITAHSTSFYPRKEDLIEFKDWLDKRSEIFMSLAGEKTLSEFMVPPYIGKRI